MRKVFGPNLVPSRRMVLRGAGATLFLPFLPSLAPRSAWGVAPTAPLRLAITVVPNGIHTPSWEPLATGAGYDLPPILTPLATLQSRFSVISGIENLSEKDAYAGHDTAMGSLLTDTPTGGGGPLDNGISIDQVLADEFGVQTPFRSMQLGVENNGSNGLSTYNTHVSWGNGDTPFPPVLDPKVAFGRMFGTSEGLSEEEIAGRKVIRSSILDSVLDRTTSLQSRASRADAAKLDQYQTAVRELELQIDRLDSIVCVEPDEPEPNTAIGEATRLMYDLMHVAFTCDLTRSITFMQGPSGSNQIYSHVAGVTQSDHSLSHGAWSSDADRAERVLMQNWQVQQFANFMQQLADTTDFDGNDLLANTICVFTSEFGDANGHWAYDDVGQPMGIGGGENAGIAQGQHRALPAQSHGNVWLSLLQLLGIDQPTFGTHGDTPIDFTT